jgi:hypothetical protein
VQQRLLDLQAANLTVAVCLLVFAWGLYIFARTNDASRFPALFVACYAVAELGAAAFPSPQGLHNVFGLSMMIGYMAPLVLAVSWKVLEHYGIVQRGLFVAFYGWCLYLGLTLLVLAK